MQLSRWHLFYSHLPLLSGTPSPISTTSIIQHWVMSQVFQPYSVLRYLPKICSRISQICLCISASKSLRWSRNIAMMSRWFALRRTSSSNGKSHSKRTSKICISRKALVTLSNPIIQPMYRSSIASRNGRLLVRSSILSTDRMAIFLLSLNTSVPTKSSGFSNFYIQRTSRPVVGVLIVQTPHLCLQDLLPTSAYQFYLLLFAYLQASCRSSHLVQTPHLCLQDSLPTSACRDILNAHLQASCRSFHCPNTSLVSPGLTPNLSLSRYSQCSSPGKLSEFSLSKHLTCVSRTHSQPQPVEILTSISKTCRLRQSIDKSPSTNDLTANMPKKWSETKHTSPESRILKLFDALDFTSAMYQPSDHFRTLVQAQHRSRENLGAQYKRSQLHLRWRP